MLSAPLPVVAAKARYSAALERIGCFGTWSGTVTPSFFQSDSILLQQPLRLSLTRGGDLSGPGASAATNRPVLCQFIQDLEIASFPAPTDKGALPQFFLLYRPESRRVMLLPRGQVHQHKRQFPDSFCLPICHPVPPPFSAIDVTIWRASSSFHVRGISSRNTAGSCLQWLCKRFVPGSSGSVEIPDRPAVRLSTYQDHSYLLKTTFLDCRRTSAI